MTVGNWATNRGVTGIGAGAWNTEASTSFQIGLLVTTQPAAADSQAEIQQMNWVSDLLVTAAAIECTATNYTRLPLSRVAVTEDDIGNRALLPVSASPYWPTLGGALNQLIIGHFIFAEGGGSDTTRPLYIVRWYDPAFDQYTTVGADYSVAMTNPVRLAA